MDHSNEEPSLGVFEAAVEDEDEEPALEELEKFEPRQRVGKYLGWHLRRQVSIGKCPPILSSKVHSQTNVRTDIWWLVWAVFAIAIIERGSLMDPDRKWFDMFRVLFELVSAFGGIGLSLGFPNVWFLSPRMAVSR